MGFRSARLRAGLKVADVQKVMGVSDAAVYLWETGVTRPRATNLVKLAELYGCTVDDLLNQSAAMNADTKAVGTVADQPMQA